MRIIPIDRRLTMYDAMRPYIILCITKLSWHSQERSGIKSPITLYIILIYGNPSLDESSKPVAMKSSSVNSLEARFDRPCSLVPRRHIQDFTGMQITHAIVSLAIYNCNCDISVRPLASYLISWESVFHVIHYSHARNICLHFVRMYRSLVPVIFFKHCIIVWNWIQFLEFYLLVAVIANNCQCSDILFDTLVLINKRDITRSNIRT